MAVECGGCGSTNREGARFCDACGAPLRRQCPSCAQEVRSEARFCDSCGAPLSGAPAPAPPRVGGEVRKAVTIVFADLAGSTSLQERMDAESARRVMDRFYDAMRAPVEAHGGRVVKFMGDGMMAVFGVPAVAEDDAVRAVRAAAAMHDAFAPLAAEVGRERDAAIGLRVGVNTGEVVVDEADDDVVGDAVNVAARLEHAAAESDVLVGEETWRLTREHFTFEAVPPLDLKGKSGPVRAFRLASLAPPVTAEASPFVGRDGERARLREEFDAAVAASHARLVTVIGSPGLGKTRLVQEFCRGVEGTAKVLEGRCDPGGSATFAPVAEVVRQAAGIEETDTPERAVAAISAMFADEGPEGERIAALAATVLGVGEPATPEETFWAVRRTVERVAAERPLVVVFDDVHWAQPMLLDLLEHLAEWARDVPLLLLALARPEIRDLRPGLADPSGRPAAVLTLEPLDADSGSRLASEMLDGHPLPDDLAPRLIEAAEGNPLFLRELVRMLIDDGVLRLEGDAWVSTTAATDLTVPPTISALLSARIERLGADERDVVERASVVGKQFFRGAVATLAPPAVATGIDAHLETLRRKELVEPEGTYWVDEPVFRFHHSLIRDAAYRRLLKEARAELHERFAAWLVDKVGELVGEHEEVIGYHLEQAFRYQRELAAPAERTEDTGRRASAHLAAAARRAVDRDNLLTAADLLERACACLPAGDPGVAELLLDRCEALLSLGDVAAGTEAVAALREEAGRTPRLAAWAEAFEVQLGALTDAEGLRAWGDRAGAVAQRFEELGDAVGLAKAAAVHANVLARLGQVAACEAALDRALAAAREAGDRRRANAVLAGAPMAALWGPSPVTRATGRCLDVVRVLRITTGSAPVEAVALRAQAVLEALRGRFDAARRLLTASRRLLEELGQRSGLLHTELCAGIVELLAGEPDAASDALEPAYEGFAAAGMRIDAGQAAAFWARARLAQGRDDEALALSEESERLGGLDLKTSIAWRAVRAEALARRGALDEARALAGEAVEIASATDAPIDHADARLALAGVLLAAGDERAAAEEAGRAAALYESKEATVPAQWARRLTGGDPASAGEDRTAALPTAPANAASRAWDEYVRRYATGDVEAVLDALAPGFVLDDRGSRALHRYEGREEMRRFLETMFLVEGHIESGLLAIRGDRLHLGHVRFHARDRLGGELVNDVLALGEVDEGGVLVSGVFFDADALDDAFDELDRRFASQVGMSHEEFVGLQRRLEEAYRTGAFGGVLEVFFASPEAEVHDHRRTGWGRITAAEFGELMAGIADIVSVAALRRVAVHRWDPPFSAVRQCVQGQGADGTPFELVYDIVTEAVGGRVARMELYDPEDFGAMLARYDELAGTARPEWAQGNLAVEAAGPGAVPVAVRGRTLAVVQVGDELRMVETDPAGAVVDTRAFGADELQAACAELNERYVSQLPPGEAAVARTSTAGLAAYQAQDWETMASLLTDDFVLVDHRPGWFGELERDAYIERLRGLFELAPDLQLVAAEIVALSPSGYLSLIRTTGSAAADSPFEITFYHLALTDEAGQRGRRFEYFDVADRERALARFHEVAGGPGAGAPLAVRGSTLSLVRIGDAHRVVETDESGVAVDSVDFADEDAAWEELDERFARTLDPAPAEAFAVTRRVGRLYNAHDFDTYRTLCHEDMRVVDHRPAGWGDVDADEYLARVAALVELAPDLTVREVELLVVGPRGGVARVRGSGTAPEGGAFEVAFYGVSRVEGGRLLRMELFPLEARDAALARHRELEAEAGPARSGPRPNEALRRWRTLEAAISALDLDAAVACYAPDIVVVDRRTSATEESIGFDQVRAWAEWGMTGSEGLSVTFEPAAVRGEHFVLGRYRMVARPRGGAGEAVFEYWQVAEFDDDWRVRRFGIFDVDDFTAAVDDLDERYAASLSGDELATWQLSREAWKAYQDADWDRFIGLAHPDALCIDHQPMGWGVFVPEDYLAWVGELLAMAPDLRFFVMEADVAAGAFRGRCVGRGTGAEGAPFEMVFDMVTGNWGGRLSSIEFFARRQEDASRDRFSELARIHGCSPAMRAWDVWFAEMRERHLDGIAARLPDGYRFVDHRLGVVLDKEQELEQQRRIAGTEGIRLTWDPVLDLGAATVTRVGYRWPGAAPSGPWASVGEGEAVDYLVGTWEDGSYTETHRFADDQLHSALALAEERAGAGTGPPTFAGMARAVDSFNAGDWDGLVATLTEDFTVHDHREAGWGTIDRDAYLAVLKSLPELSREVRWVIRDLYWHVPGALAVLWSAEGVDGGGGAFQLAYVSSLRVAADGRACRADLYAPERVEQALADARAAGA